jgi:hypothetical protein
MSNVLANETVFASHVKGLILGEWAEKSVSGNFAILASVLHKYL